MKTSGRAQSKNIDDRRSYFGNSQTVGNRTGKINAFKMESYKAARDYSGKQPYHSFSKSTPKKPSRRTGRK